MLSTELLTWIGHRKEFQSSLRWAVYVINFLDWRRSIHVNNSVGNAKLQRWQGQETQWMSHSTHSILSPTLFPFKLININPTIEMIRWKWSYRWLTWLWLLSGIVTLSSDHLPEPRALPVFCIAKESHKVFAELQCVLIFQCVYFIQAYKKDNQ